MTPEKYQALQTMFLHMRGLEPEVRVEELNRLAAQDPEAAKWVRDLLAVPDEDSFLQPLVDTANVECGEDSQYPETQFHSRCADELPDGETKQIGPYRILQKIGEGGHGIVFMAEQTSPIRRRVAIKCIKPGMASKPILARFEAERQALAMMSHPSIANVIDAGETDEGQPFFVLELVHGIPIDQFCAENDLALDERLRLFQQVCDAVHHAHQKGVIHRDIKPANVLVTVASGKPLAKVIDFGIAKALHMPLTEKTMFTEYGQIVGTLEYMSPEQAMLSQSGADVRSDVYSLGALLYFLLTGVTPIGKEILLQEGLWELKKVLREVEPATPSLRLSRTTEAQKWKDQAGENHNWSPQLKGDLDWITMKALAKEPELRYDSAAALCADIENHLTGEPVCARPPSLRYSAQKWIKKNRVASTLAAGALLSVLIAVGGLVWGYLQSLQNLTVAEKATELANDRAVLLEQSLAETQQEKERADGNAKRLSLMLERSLLESAWTAALNGSAEKAARSLEDISSARRGAVWDFVHAVSLTMDWPSLRNETAGPIRAIDIYSPENQLAVVTTDSRVEVWDVSRRKQTTEVQLKDGIYSTIKLGMDGSKLLVGGAGDLQLIDLRKGITVTEKTLGRGGIRQIEYLANANRWVVTTGANYVISLNGPDLEIVSSVKLPERIDRICCSLDEKWIAVGGLTGTLFVFETGNIEQYRSVNSDIGSYQQLKWSEDAVVGLTRSLTRMRLPLTEIEMGFQGPQSYSMKIESEGISADPARESFRNRIVDVEFAEESGVFVGDASGSVGYFDFESENAVPLRDFSVAIEELQILKSGDLLVRHLNGRINLISQQDWSCRVAYTSGLSGLTDGVCFGDSDYTITGHSDGSIKKWQTTTGQCEHELRRHSAELLSLSVHEQKNLIASMGLDWKIALTSATTMAPIAELSVGGGVRTVAFSQNGKWLAGAPDIADQNSLNEGTVDLWDLQSLSAKRRLVGHRNWVIRSRFFEEDQKLATLALDGTIRIWDVTTGDCVVVLDLSAMASGQVFEVSEATGELIVGHTDGTVSRWDLGTGACKCVKHLFGGSIVGMVFASDSSCVFVAADNRPEIVCVDPVKLEVIAKLDAGVGNIVDLRTDLARRKIQVFGNRGAIRVWPFGL